MKHRDLNMQLMLFSFVHIFAASKESFCSDHKHNLCDKNMVALTYSLLHHSHIILDKRLTIIISNIILFLHTGPVMLDEFVEWLRLLRSQSTIS